MASVKLSGKELKKLVGEVEAIRESFIKFNDYQGYYQQCNPDLDENRDWYLRLAKGAERSGNQPDSIVIDEHDRERYFFLLTVDVDGYNKSVIEQHEYQLLQKRNLEKDRAKRLEKQPVEVGIIPPPPKSEEVVSLIRRFLRDITGG